mmetsp:Transcript_23572/g.56110  ORF Transcript_23572/g.56110 Transcript_23572/m.56110 type:complete len:344 (+) Transcript_23572:1749-2780(+)
MHRRLPRCCRWREAPHSAAAQKTRCCHRCSKTARNVREVPELPHNVHRSATASRSHRWQHRQDRCLLVSREAALHARNVDTVVAHCDRHFSRAHHRRRAHNQIRVDESRRHYLRADQAPQSLALHEVVPKDGHRSPALHRPAGRRDPLHLDARLKLESRRRGREVNRVEAHVQRHHPLRVLRRQTLEGARPQPLRLRRLTPEAAHPLDVILERTVHQHGRPALLRPARRCNPLHRRLLEVPEHKTVYALSQPRVLEAHRSGPGTLGTRLANDQRRRNHSCVLHFSRPKLDGQVVLSQMLPVDHQRAPPSHDPTPRVHPRDLGLVQNSEADKAGHRRPIRRKKA